MMKKFKYTHGIDIIELSRQELNNFKFAKRFMTNNEYNNFLLIKNNNEKRKYMASIWCLKEAIIKATNHKYLFSEINITLSYNKEPICNILNINLSISYEINYIIASAIYSNN